MAVAALLTAGTICGAGLALGLGLLPLLPLANLYRPDDRRTFSIFKVASLFMVFAFLWLLVGVRGGF